VSALDRLWADARRAHAAGRLDEAVAAYEEILASRPGDGTAWMNLGAVLRAAGRAHASVACHRRALECRPDDPRVLTNLGNALKDLDRLDESVACHRRAVALDSGNATLHHNLGVALRQQRECEAAVAAFERARALAPERADMRWDLALELLKLGEFARGWPAYEARWELAGTSLPELGRPMWDGGPLTGKTLLLHSEQGFGDTLLALRFLPALKERGARVLLQVRPELFRLLRGLSCVDGLIVRGEALPPFDLHCPLMSLPGRLGVHASSLPPHPALTLPEQARAKMRREIPDDGRRQKVGIVWSGSVSFADNRRRAARLEHFLRLLEVPGLSLYSLQKGPPQRALKAAGAGALVQDLAPHIADFADTAAALEQLDLVVMTDTAVAHLAGLLGRPVWNLLSFSSYWLYGRDGERTPWYSSMRLFRQRSPGDWDELFDRVVAELRLQRR